MKGTSIKMVVQSPSIRRTSKNCSDFCVTRPHHIFRRFSDAAMREKESRKAICYFDVWLLSQSLLRPSKTYFVCATTCPQFASEIFKDAGIFQFARLPVCTFNTRCDANRTIFQWLPKGLCCGNIKSTQNNNTYLSCVCAISSPKM